LAVVDLGNCGFVSYSVQPMVAHNYMRSRIYSLARFAKTEFQVAFHRHRLKPVLLKNNPA